MWFSPFTRFGQKSTSTPNTSSKKITSLSFLLII